MQTLVNVYTHSNVFGLTQESSNGTRCVPCRKGTYDVVVGAGSCRPCPLGAECEASSVVAGKGKFAFITVITGNQV